MIYLILFLLLKFTFTMFIGRFEDSAQVFLWSAFLLTQPILLSLALKNLVRDPRVKIAAFVILVVSITALTGFVIEWCLYEHFKEISSIIEILNIMVIVPLCFNAICKLYISISARYNPGKSYLGFLKPKNTFGLVAALVKSPYGHCFLITEGKMFKFSKGVLVEVSYKDSKSFYLKEINRVPIYEVRKLVGSKWGFFNNCFTVFRKYK
ncbi:MAG: hypothetical protein ACPGJI_05475 [Kangiellaceae bacterium]